MSDLSDDSEQQTMPKPRRERLADLDCIVVDGSEHPDIPVIVCHGYGAPGHDLAGLSLEWLDLLQGDASRFRFVFPAAPISLADQGMPDGRAWWPLNMARLLEMAGASRFDELHDEEPPGLSEAREVLLATIASAIDTMPNGTDHGWAVGGFSQGAMLTMDATLRSELPPPTLLMQFSGTMICQPTWRERVARLRDTYVLQSHGTIDPILPYDSALRLRDMLSDAATPMHFHSFDGPHTIDPETVGLAAQSLRRIVHSSSETP